MLFNPAQLDNELRHEVRGGKGDVRFITLPKDQLPNKTRLFGTIVIPEGCSLGVHDHVNETEFYYIISGTGIGDDNGKQVQFAPGDIMTCGNGATHNIENNGKGDLVLIACVVLD